MPETKELSENSSMTGKADLPLKDPGISDASSGQAVRRMIPLRILFLILPIAIAFGGVLGLYFQPPGLRAFFSITGLEPGAGTNTPIAVAIEKVSKGEEVSILSGTDVVALGRLTPRGNVATVSPPYGSGDARVESIEVGIGDVVSRGQVVAVLDNLSQFQAALKIAEANLDVREATLAQTRLTTRASLEEAMASLNRAEVTSEAAFDDLERMTTLLQRGVTTRAEFDRTQKDAAQALRDVEKARATLSRYTVDGQTIQADIAVAEANVSAAQAEVLRAQADLERAFVRSPIDGQVLQVHVGPGEKPSTEGVVDVGDTSQMTAELEVFQTMIGRVDVGDDVVMSALALPQDLSGKVIVIGLEVGRQSLIDGDPAANTDARVVDVIVELDKTSSELASTFTNLEVVARVKAGPAE